jgi:hypothetical protein
MATEIFSLRVLDAQSGSLSLWALTGALWDTISTVLSILGQYHFYSFTISSHRSANMETFASFSRFAAASSCSYSGTPQLRIASCNCENCSNGGPISSASELKSFR